MDLTKTVELEYVLHNDELALFERYEIVDNIEGFLNEVRETVFNEFKEVATLDKTFVFKSDSLFFKG